MRQPIPPLQVADLFPPMRRELLNILARLADDDWQKPTACTGWSVRDVALRILGDDVGLLSGLRDHDGRGRHFESYDELLAFINQRNDQWIQAARRMSRPLLLSLLAYTGQQWAEFAASLDPLQMAGPIGWTGNAADPMWLHLARELTEYWMHHQHIAEALGLINLKDARFVHPVLSTFLQALPRTYREIAAPENSLVKVVITGQGGGEWHLIRNSAAWTLYANSDLSATAVVILDVNTAWHLFTKGIGPDEARAHTLIEGDQALGAVFLDTVAILA